jgi:hypothetical protein
MAERALRRVLWELRAYLPDLVLIGGWVPFLYRRHGGFRTWRGGESLTREVDILTEEELPTKGRATISKRLEDAGFHPLGKSRHAAVWVRDIEAGEKVEFFVEHRGTARGRSSVRAIREQPGLGAISLAGLEFMRAHSGVLGVPTTDAAGKPVSLEVRVPLLGAFAVDKAMTFPQRSAGVGVSVESKRAKDLLYLHDLMAAGEEVTDRIDREIAEFRAEAGRTRDVLGNAAHNLRLLHGGQWMASVRKAARMLVERGDVTNEDVGVADIQGYLDDFLDLLTAADAR